MEEDEARKLVPKGRNAYDLFEKGESIIFGGSAKDGVEHPCRCRRG
jgi:hypothetical protein